MIENPERMKKIIAITIILLSGLISSCGYRLVKVEDAYPTSTVSQIQILETQKLTKTHCSISENIKPGWATEICYDFSEDESTIWQGNDGGIHAYISSGSYILDNKTQATSGYTTGYVYGVDVYSGNNYLVSVDGRLDSVYRDCMLGIYMGGSQRYFGYFFLIDNQGRWTLTYDTDNEAMRYLGNINSGQSGSIVWDETNRITGVMEDGELYFYINGDLITSYDTEILATTGAGLMIWGGEGVIAKNIFDNLLVKTD